MKVYILSHGDLAKEIIKSAEMISFQKLDYIPVCLEPKDSKEDYEAKLIAALPKDSDYADVLAICDLYGGTPFQVSLKVALTSKLTILTGLNLGMLLEAACSSVETPKELAEQLIEVSNNGMQILDESFGK